MWRKFPFSILVFLLALSSLLLAPMNPVYAVKFGINVAANGGFEQAAKLVGTGGWIVVMIEPEETTSVIADAQKAQVNLVIRARHDFGGAVLNANYAQEWVNAFKNSNILSSVYFVPINEPNNNSEGIDCTKPDLKAYLDGLLSGLQSAGLKGTKMQLVTPSFDPFQFADGNTACYTQLGGPTYFAQFDAVSYHAYGQMRTTGMDTGASPIKQGSVQAFLNVLGQPQTMSVIIDETGVGCLDCAKPDMGGGSWVKYPYTQQYVDMFSTYLHSNYVQSEWTQSNVKMFAMLSYSPETPVPDNGSWIDTSFASQVVRVAQGAVGGGSGQINPIPTQRLIPTPTGLPGPVDRHIRNRSNMMPQSQAKTFEGASTGDSCFFLDFHCQDLQRKIQEAVDKPVKSQAQIAQEPAPPSNIFESIGSFFDNLFNVSSTPQGYANSYFSQKNTVGDGTGLGGTSASQDETVKTHQQIFDSLLPYRASNTFVGTTDVDYVPNPVVTGPNPTGPVPLISVALSPPPATDNAAVFADYVFNVVHTSCTNPGFDNPRMTIALNAVTIQSCLQGRLPNNVYSTMYQSAFRHTWLQCVGYVQAIEAGSGGGAMEARSAKDYCNGNAPAGYVYINSSQIQTGDIAVMTNPPWGHIAVIKQVFPNGRITVDEANWGTNGAIGTNRIALLGNWGCFLRRSN